MSSFSGRWVAVACIGLLVASSGCSWLHRGGHKCREPGMSTGLANGPGLVVPQGLDAPDTRGAVHIPDLKEPELPRSAKDPCLSSPPDYKTNQP
jgi:hypothetical protein